jgi:preprotein translocase subunit SecY
VNASQGFSNVLKIPDLQKRIFFTLGLLAVYRVGVYVPTAGINTQALAQFIEEAARGTLLGMFNMFSGGGLSRLTIFTLGIMPYISASIILQLLTVVWPFLERLSKEGEHGRKKITQYTRYGTIVLAAVQALGIAIGLESMQDGAFVNSPGWWFRFMTVITLTSGTAFIMWLGEKITERGIGNGISLIIAAGIVERLPAAIFSSFEQLRTGAMRPFVIFFILVLAVGTVALIVIMQLAQRRIPVQYAKRVVGRRQYGGQQTHIPLRINTAGVIPVIFASSIILFPLTIARFLDPEGKYAALQWFVDNLNPASTSPVYIVTYVAAIVFFCFFYTAIVFNPVDVADNMKKYGGYIHGIRPGKKTANHIDRILTRITVLGSLFLAAIAVLPMVLIAQFNVPFYLGGTGLLIVVGVTLDTVQQIESHLLMRHYEGFLKGGSPFRRRT